MQFHERLDQRQSQPQAAGGALERGVNLEEPIEDPADLLVSDANAVIDDADDGTASVRLDGQAHVAAPRRELGGVAQQVMNDLRQARGSAATTIGAVGKATVNWTPA